MQLHTVKGQRFFSSWNKYIGGVLDPLEPCKNKQSAFTDWQGTTCYKENGGFLQSQWAPKYSVQLH